MSKSLEQLILEINENVEREDFEKKASASDNLTDLWMQAMGAQAEPTSGEENVDMYEFTKMAAAEDALDTMCIHYAYDLLTGSMHKQASLMNREASQEMVIGHCMQYGWTPENCIMKEASDRVMGDISALSANGANAFWSGFMKAAADDASAGPADGAGGATPNSVSVDYNGYRNQAPNMNEATGSVMPLGGGATSIDAMIAKVLSGNGSAYAHQGVLSHDFLP